MASACFKWVAIKDRRLQRPSTPYTSPDWVLCGDTSRSFGYKISPAPHGTCECLRCLLSVVFAWIRCCLALGTAAESNDDAFATTSGKPNVSRHKNSKQTYSSSSGGSTCNERLRDGCSPLEWHDFHFLTCEIHKIDLRLVVRKRRYGVILGGALPNLFLILGIKNSKQYL
jgi:hypothetical protein